MGRRQAVRHGLLVPAFHRFESCRPRIRYGKSLCKSRGIFFALAVKRGVAGQEVGEKQGRKVNK